MKKLLRLMLLAALFVPLGATAQTTPDTVFNMATSGSDTLRACSATIYDDGGPNASYSSNCDATLVLLPNIAGQYVSISGTSYTESTYDYITIYEGVGTDGTVLWTDYGIDAQTPFGPFRAAAITVAFHSDGSVTRSGFEINVTCVDPPTCFPLSSLTATTVSSTEINLAWTDADNTGASYQIAYVAAGSTDTVTLSPVTGTSYTVTGLDPVTTYTFIVTPICSDGDAVPSTATAMTDCGEGSCYYVFDMHDRYGDGWNGNAFEVYQNSSLMGTATIISGNYGLDSVRVCNTTDPATLRIVYISGSFANEMSGYINAGAGRIFDISTITSYANGAEVFSSDVTCPSCVSPVVSDSIDDDGNIVLTWTGDASQYIVYMGDSIVDDNVSANEITLTDIPASTILQLSVQAVCGADDTS